jgi:hypothetical protein
MQLNRVMLLAGLLAMSGGFSYAVAAECTHPSQEEREAQRAALFAEADANDDNALSRTEFTTFGQLVEAARADRHFACLDSNSDSSVSAEELSAQHSHWGRGPKRPF